MPASHQSYIPPAKKILVPGSVRVQTLRSVQDMEQLRTFWSSCPGTRDSDIDICLTRQRSTPDILRPHIVVLYRDERPIALLIGRIVRRRLPFSVGYFKLFNPLVNVMTFPYGSLRGDSSMDNCRILVGEVFESLKNGEADLALIEHIPKDSPLFDYSRRIPGLLFRDYFCNVRPHWKRELQDKVEQLHKSFSANERHNYRKIVKKLSNSFPGQVRVASFDKPSDLLALLETVEEVARVTWQRRLGTGFSTDLPLLEIFRTEVENGWLRGYILYLNDVPRAFWVGAVYQATFYSDFMGYDPEYAQYSLGMYLLWQMMEKLSLEGVKGIDFGFSDEEWKKRFANTSSQETSPHLFAPTVRGFSLNIRKSIAMLLHEPARALLGRTKLIQRAKRIWRKAARTVSSSHADAG